MTYIFTHDLLNVYFNGILLEKKIFFKYSDKNNNKINGFLSVDDACLHARFHELHFTQKRGEDNSK